MISVAREHGDRIPAPDVSAGSYSGNIRLRLPRSLHARLDALAGAEGVSLNQLMVSILAEGAGSRGERYKLLPSSNEEFFGVAESPMGTDKRHLKRGAQKKLGPGRHGLKR